MSYMGLYFSSKFDLDVLSSYGTFKLKLISTSILSAVPS